ncbi:MAG: hypothetical protein V1897_10885, partial [Pseudomonadota bacterium]
MLNKFTYRSDISSHVMEKLRERESICESAIADNSELVWSRDVDDLGQSVYVLTRHGLVHTELGRLSEDEVFQLKEESFKEKMFMTESYLQEEHDYVVWRINEWRERLLALYEDVKSWLPKDCKLNEGEIVQLREVLMTQHQVAPVALPTLEIG